MAGTGFDSGSDVTMPTIVKTADVLDGDPRIEGRRIRVFDVYHRYVGRAERPEEIAVRYDISEAEVYAALAYGFSNPEEMQDIENRAGRVDSEGSTG